jgi:hypothetical protein
MGNSDGHYEVSYIPLLADVRVDELVKGKNVTSMDFLELSRYFPQRRSL